MKTRDKILIVDEAGFSRVCSSILAGQGFHAECMIREEWGTSPRCIKKVSLLITSYPYGAQVLKMMHGLSVPVIVLADYTGKDIIDILEGLENSYCMVKPINYERFTLLVKNLVNETCFHGGGYSIV
jgi:hypothetical protein